MSRPRSSHPDLAAYPRFKARALKTKTRYYYRHHNGREEPLGDKSKRALREGKRDLRRLIESTDDTIIAKIAYSMETAIIWATEETFGWESLSKEAIIMADLLRKEIGEVRQLK